MLTNLDVAISHGAAHIAHDTELVMSDWGFLSPEGTSTPVELWHGELDNSVPPIMSEKFHQRSKSSTLRIIPDKEHFMIFEYWPKILESLVENEDFDEEFNVKSAYVSGS